MRVGGDRFDAKDTAQIVALQLLFQAPLKLQQRWILQVEQREGTEIEIPQALLNAVRTTLIRERFHRLRKAIQQSTKSKLPRAAPASPPHSGHSIEEDTTKSLAYLQSSTQQ